MNKFTRRELLCFAGAAVVGHAFAGCDNSQKIPRNHTISKNTGEMIVTPQGRILPADAALLEKQILYEAAAEPRHLDIARDIYGAGVAINWGGEPLLRRDQNQNLVPALAESFTAGPNAEFYD